LNFLIEHTYPLTRDILMGFCCAIGRYDFDRSWSVIFLIEFW